MNYHNTKVVWRLLSWPKIYDMTELSLFKIVFPVQWVRGVLVTATIEENSGDEITLQDFYVYLGCYLFMACFEEISDRILWWSPKPASIQEGPPFRLKKYMSLRWFISITSAVRFTNKPSPSFLDRFHDVRQMINNFNAHYLENYTLSWLSCLDEFMNSFLDKFCPGFMSVPRKPHPLGNDCHRIEDGDEGNPVIYCIKIQEGKDRPKDANGKWVFHSKFEVENTNMGRK